MSEDLEFLASHCGPHNTDLIRRGMDCDLSLAEALKAVVAALSQSEWLDIATAPKDQFILLHEDGAIRCGMWEGGKWAPAEIPILVDEVGNRITSRELTLLRSGQRLELSGFLYEPTHWQPLPPPPQDKP